MSTKALLLESLIFGCFAVACFRQLPAFAASVSPAVALTVAAQLVFLFTLTTGRPPAPARKNKHVIG